MSGHQGRNGFRLAYVVAAISVLLIVASVVVAVVLTDKVTTESTPLISAVLTLAAVLLPALVAMFKSDQAVQKTEAVDKKVNGHIGRLTEAAINAGVKPEDLPPLPPEIEQPESDK